MFGYQIRKILETDTVTKRYFRGIYASDSIGDGNFVMDYNSNNIFICNTSRSNDKVGVHWVLIFKNAETTIFVDSLRRPVEFYSDEIIEFLGDAYETVPFTLQGPNSNMCAYFCLYFCRYLSGNIPLGRILSEFGNNTVHNENIVLRFYKRVYKKILPICSVEDVRNGVDGMRCLSLDDFYQRIGQNKL